MQIELHEKLLKTNPTEFYYNGFHVIKKTGLKDNEFVVGNIINYTRLNKVRKFTFDGAVVKELV